MLGILRRRTATAHHTFCRSLSLLSRPTHIPSRTRLFLVYNLLLQNAPDPTLQSKPVPDTLPHSGEANTKQVRKEEDGSSFSIFEGGDPYMDTFAVYTQLERAGFSESESNVIIDVVIAQLNVKLRQLAEKYTTIGEVEDERYLFESAQEELRVDITRSRAEHINELLGLINILERDFHVILNELNGAFISMRNDSQVAINDQKSENTLMLKLIILKIQETNHKITTELNLPIKSEIESLRWHLSRWGLIFILIVVFSGCAVFYVHKTHMSRKLSARDQFIPLVIREPSEYEDDEYDADTVEA